MGFLSEMNYSYYVEMWQLKGLTKSIRASARVYLIDNEFLAQEGLPRQH